MRPFAPRLLRRLSLLALGACALAACTGDGGVGATLDASPGGTFDAGAGAALDATVGPDEGVVYAAISAQADASDAASSGDTSGDAAPGDADFVDTPSDAGPLPEGSSHYQVLAPAGVYGLASDDTRVFYSTSVGNLAFPSGSSAEVHAIAKDAGVPYDFPSASTYDFPSQLADTSVVLAQVDGNVDQLLLREGNALYWTSYLRGAPDAGADGGTGPATATIHRTPTDGSGPDVVILRDRRLLGIDADSFYVGAATSLLSVPRAGGPEVLLVTEEAGAQQAYITATDVYWTARLPDPDSSHLTGVLRKRARAGGPVVTLYAPPSQGFVSCPAFDGKTIMCGATGQLFLRFTVDDQRLVVAHHDYETGLVAFDGTDAYAVSSAGLLRLGPDGGPDTVLASYASSISLLVDRDGVYLGHFFPFLLMKHAR